MGAGRTDRSKSSQHGILLQSLCQISRSQWVSSALHLLICSTCFLLKGSSFAIQAVIQHCYAALLFSTVIQHCYSVGMCATQPSCPIHMDICTLERCTGLCHNHSDKYFTPNVDRDGLHQQKTFILSVLFA